jgi:ribose 5-phosphate isomerase A
MRVTVGRSGAFDAVTYMPERAGGTHLKFIQPAFPVWVGEIANREAKETIARSVAARARNGEVIGIGSGSTSYLTVIALGERVGRDGLSIVGIPTSAELGFACAAAGIVTSTLQALRPDWAFDGADEVDERGRLIKGRGGALLHEKAVMAMCPNTLILIDDSKLVARLGSRFAVPVEVVPYCVHHVIEALGGLGATEVTLRMAKGKDGPVITEAGNLLLDARFAAIDDSLEAAIAAIVGVVESGLFIGYRIEIVNQSRS